MRHELDNAVRRSPVGDVPWIAVCGWVAAACAAAAGLTLVARRLSGAILASADPAVVMPAVIVAAALVLLADAGVRAGLPRGIALLARGGGGLTAASLLVPPAATTPLGWATLASAAGLLAAVIVLEPALPRRPGPPSPGRPPKDRGGRPRRRPATARPPPRRRPETPPPPASDRGLPAEDDAAAGDVVRQRLVRRETADGRDTVAGELRIAVPLGARLASGHVGFCPSFQQLPSVEVATDYDGVEAVVTVGELLPWGVRIDCRLAEPAEEPLDIPVSFVARATAGS
jgi:hypothetical protein